MAYSRRETQDGVTVMNKDLYDNLQDGIDDLFEDKVNKSDYDIIVEGNPINFDVTEEQNLTSCEVELEPYQDLNGYTKPWNGGSGKNKANPDDLYLEINGDTNFEVSTLPFYEKGIPIHRTYYTLSIKYPSSSITRFQVELFNESSDTIDLIFDDSGVNHFSFRPSNAQTCLYFSITVENEEKPNNVEETEIMLEENSTLTSYEPYYNICPILNVGNIEIETFGKNLFNKNLQMEKGRLNATDGSIDTTFDEYCVTPFQEIPMSGKYTLYQQKLSSYYSICWYNQNKQYISGYQKVDFTPCTVDIPDGAKYVRYTVTKSALHAFQFEKGDGYTGYAPYEKNVYSVNVNGIEYFGILDVTKGTLKVTSVLEEFNGEESWVEGDVGGTDIFKTKLKFPTPGANEIHVIMSNMYDAYYVYNLQRADSGIAVDGTYIYVKDIYNAVDTGMEYLSQHPLQVVYNLLYPFEIQVTLPQSIKATQGNNTVCFYPSKLDGSVIFSNGIASLANLSRVEKDTLNKSSTGYQIITGNPLKFDSLSPQSVEIKCDIEAEQDLNGFDKPWVGGAGKNKLPLILSDIKSLNTGGTWSGDTYSYNGVDFTVNLNSSGAVESITVSGQATTDVFLALYNSTFESGTYALNGCPSGGGSSTYFLRARVDSTTNADDTGSGIAITVASSVFCFIQIRAGNNLDLTFYPMISLISAPDRTFEPYSNICPITGISTATVQRVGKNRLNPFKVKSGFQYNSTAGTQLVLTDISDMQEVAFGQFQKEITAWQCIGYLFPLTSETMYFKIHYKGSGARCTYGYLDADLKVVSAKYDNVSDLTKEGIIQRSGTSAYFFFMVTSNANATIEIDEPQIEVGSVATSYEPYQGDTYTIDLDGTRYGGQLDVDSGVLTLTHAGVIFDGSDDEDWVKGSESWANQNIFNGTNLLPNTYVYNGYSTIADLQSNMVVTSQAPSTMANTANAVGIGQGGDSTTQYLYVALSPQITTLADFKTYLSNNNLQVVYKLATPQTIQLTPTQVWSLQGSNTITVSVDEVEAKIHSSNYATLNDINDLWNYIKQSPQVSDGVRFGASNLEMIGGTMS